MADIKPTYTGSEKLVTSDILYQNMKNFDARREQKVHSKLWETIPEVPEHYILANPQDGSIGLVIVTDGTISNPDTEVELATVTGKILPDDLHSYQVGEYVVLIPVVPESEKEIYLKATDLDVENELLDLDEFDNVAP